MCRRDSPLDTCGPFGVNNYIVFSQLYMVFHLSISISLDNGIGAKDTPSGGIFRNRRPYGRCETHDQAGQDEFRYIIQDYFPQENHDDADQSQRIY